MTSDVLIGSIGVAALAGAWVFVQLAWAREFPSGFDDSDEPDVLARRGGCGDCTRPGPCRRRLSNEEDRT